MTRINAYIRLMKWKWNKNKKSKAFFVEFDMDGEITEFDLQPYLGWMEEENSNCKAFS